MIAPRNRKPWPRKYAIHWVPSATTWTITAPDAWRVPSVWIDPRGMSGVTTVG
jgi:hypothetical protein